MKKYDILKDNNNLILPEKNPTKIGSITTKNLVEQQVLQKLEPVDSNIRAENILLVNSWQESILKELNNLQIYPSDHENSRKLVAYFRPSQISESNKAQVIAIMEFLRTYVEGGYSKLFDEFAVLYRFPEYDFLKKFEDNSYKVSGDDFRALSTIYADTIHFSNGTPDIVPGNIPILGTTPHKRFKNKLPHIHLELEYEPIEKTAGRGFVSEQEKRKIEKLLQPKNLVPVLKTVLQTIQQLENILIDEAKKFHEK